MRLNGAGGSVGSGRVAGDTAMHADQALFAIWVWRAGRLGYFSRLRRPHFVFLDPDVDAAWRFSTAEAAWAFISRDAELSGKARGGEAGVADIGARYGRS
jgi:hypothetical protein